MISLYTKNHTEKTGITDLITLIHLIAKKEKVNIANSNKLERKVNIFIDEFSSVYEINKLKQLKEKKKLKYVLICTEFETKTTNGKSFNEFKVLNKIDSLIVNTFSFFLLFVPRMFRGKAFVGKFSACLLLPFVILRLLFYKTFDSKVLIDNIKTIKRSVYMKARWIGYNKFLKNVDLVIKIHPLLDDSNNLVLYPFYEDIKKINNDNIKVSGTETSYRINKCYEFKKKLKNEKPKFKFNFNGKINFDTAKINKIFGYAYQPAQSSTWNKSNPIKIWRDLFFHDAVPIVDKIFNDHAIEDIALTKHDFFSSNHIKSTLEVRQKKYLQLAEQMNKQIFKKIKIMTKS